MTLLEGIVLGAVQGLTEFLPISSSGHLVLAKAAMDVEAAAGGASGIFLEVAVHAATLLAVLLYFRKRVIEILASLPALLALSSAPAGKREDLRLAGLLMLGTVPAGLAGIILKKHVEAAFNDPVLVLAMLCVTGLVLLATKFAPRGAERIGIGRAMAIGVAQAVALTPGISRSGSTISCAMFTKVEGGKAAEFSFLLSVPAIAGAAILELAKGPVLIDAVPVAAAFATAFVTGYAAMILLFGALKKRAFWLFGFYCLGVGAGGIVLNLLGILEF